MFCRNILILAILVFVTVQYAKGYGSEEKYWNTFYYLISVMPEMTVDEYLNLENKYHIPLKEAKAYRKFITELFLEEITRVLTSPLKPEKQRLAAQTTRKRSIHDIADELQKRRVQENSDISLPLNKDILMDDIRPRIRRRLGKKFHPNTDDIEVHSPESRKPLWYQDVDPLDFEIIPFYKDDDDYMYHDGIGTMTTFNEDGSPEEIEPQAGTVAKEIVNESTTEKLLNDRLKEGQTESGKMMETLDDGVRKHFITISNDSAIQTPIHHLLEGEQQAENERINKIGDFKQHYTTFSNDSTTPKPPDHHLKGEDPEDSEEEQDNKANDPNFKQHFYIKKEFSRDGVPVSTQLGFVRIPVTDKNNLPNIAETADLDLLKGAKDKKTNGDKSFAVEKNPKHFLNKDNGEKMTETLSEIVKNMKQDVQTGNRKTNLTLTANVTKKESNSLNTSVAKNPPQTETTPVIPTPTAAPLITKVMATSTNKTTTEVKDFFLPKSTEQNRKYDSDKNSSTVDLQSERTLTTSAPKSSYNSEKKNISQEIGHLILSPPTKNITVNSTGPNINLNERPDIDAKTQTGLLPTSTPYFENATPLPSPASSLASTTIKPKQTLPLQKPLQTAHEQATNTNTTFPSIFSPRQQNESFLFSKTHRDQPIKDFSNALPDAIKLKKTKHAWKNVTHLNSTRSRGSGTPPTITSDKFNTVELFNNKNEKLQLKNSSTSSPAEDNTLLQTNETSSFNAQPSLQSRSASSSNDLSPPAEVPVLDPIESIPTEDSLVLNTASTLENMDSDTLYPQWEDIDETENDDKEFASKALPDLQTETQKRLKTKNGKSSKKLSQKGVTNALPLPMTNKSPKDSADRVDLQKRKLLSKPGKNSWLNEPETKLSSDKYDHSNNNHYVYRTKMSVDNTEANKGSGVTEYDDDYRFFDVPEQNEQQYEFRNSDDAINPDQKSSQIQNTFPDKNNQFQTNYQREEQFNNEPEKSEQRDPQMNDNDKYNTIINNINSTLLSDKEVAIQENGDGNNSEMSNARSQTVIEDTSSVMPNKLGNSNSSNSLKTQSALEKQIENASEKDVNDNDSSRNQFVQKNQEDDAIENYRVFDQVPIESENNYVESDTVMPYYMNNGDELGKQNTQGGIANVTIEKNSSKLLPGIPNVKSIENQSSTLGLNTKNLNNQAEQNGQSVNDNNAKMYYPLKDDLTNIRTTTAPIIENKNPPAELHDQTKSETPILESLPLKPNQNSFENKTGPWTTNPKILVENAVTTVAPLNDQDALLSKPELKNDFRPNTPALESPDMKQSNYGSSDYAQKSSKIYNPLVTSLNDQQMPLAEKKLEDSLNSNTSVNTSTQFPVPQERSNNQASTMVNPTFSDSLSQKKKENVNSKLPNEGQRQNLEKTEKSSRLSHENSDSLSSQNEKAQQLPYPENRDNLVQSATNSNKSFNGTADEYNDEFVEKLLMDMILDYGDLYDINKEQNDSESSSAAADGEAVQPRSASGAEKDLLHMFGDDFQNLRDAIKKSKSSGTGKTSSRKLIEKFTGIDPVLLAKGGNKTTSYQMISRSSSSSTYSSQSSTGPGGKTGYTYKTKKASSGYEESGQPWGDMKQQIKKQSKKQFIKDLLSSAAKEQGMNVSANPNVTVVTQNVSSTNNQQGNQGFEQSQTVVQKYAVPATQDNNVQTQGAKTTSTQETLIIEQPKTIPQNQQPILTNNGVVSPLIPTVPGKLVLPVIQTLNQHPAVVIYPHTQGQQLGAAKLPQISQPVANLAVATPSTVLNLTGQQQQVKTIAPPQYNHARIIVQPVITGGNQLSSPISTSQGQTTQIASGKNQTPMSPNIQRPYISQNKQEVSNSTTSNMPGQTLFLNNSPPRVSENSLSSNSQRTESVVSSTIPELDLQFPTIPAITKSFPTLTSTNISVSFPQNISISSQILPNLNTGNVSIFPQINSNLNLTAIHKKSYFSIDKDVIEKEMKNFTIPNSGQKQHFPSPGQIPTLNILNASKLNIPETLIHNVFQPEKQNIPIIIPRSASSGADSTIYKKDEENNQRVFLTTRTPVRQEAKSPESSDMHSYQVFEKDKLVKPDYETSNVSKETTITHDENHRLRNQVALNKNNQNSRYFETIQNQNYGRVSDNLEPTNKAKAPTIEANENLPKSEESTANPISIIIQAVEIASNGNITKVKSLNVHENNNRNKANFENKFPKMDNVILNNAKSKNVFGVDKDVQRAYRHKEITNANSKIIPEQSILSSQNSGNRKYENMNSFQNADKRYHVEKYNQQPEKQANSSPTSDNRAPEKPLQMNIHNKNAEQGDVISQAPKLKIFASEKEAADRYFSNEKLHVRNEHLLPTASEKPVLTYVDKTVNRQDDVQTKGLNNTIKSAKNTDGKPYFERESFNPNFGTILSTERPVATNDASKSQNHYTPVQHVKDRTVDNDEFKRGFTNSKKLTPEKLSSSKTVQLPQSNYPSKASESEKINPNVNIYKPIHLTDNLNPGLPYNSNGKIKADIQISNPVDTFRKSSKQYPAASNVGMTSGSQYYQKTGQDLWNPHKNNFHDSTKSLIDANDKPIELESPKIWAQLEKPLSVQTSDFSVNTPSADVLIADALKSDNFDVDYKKAPTITQGQTTNHQNSPARFPQNIISNSWPSVLETEKLRKDFQQTDNVNQNVKTDSKQYKQPLSNYHDSQSATVSEKPQSKITPRSNAQVQLQQQKTEPQDKQTIDSIKYHQSNPEVSMDDLLQDIWVKNNNSAPQSFKTRAPTFESLLAPNRDLSRYAQNSRLGAFRNTETSKFLHPERLIATPQNNQQVPIKDLKVAVQPSNENLRQSNINNPDYSRVNFTKPKPNINNFPLEPAIRTVGRPFKDIEKYTPNYAAENKNEHMQTDIKVAGNRFLEPQPLKKGQNLPISPLETPYIKPNLETIPPSQTMFPLSRNDQTLAYSKPNFKSGNLHETSLGKGIQLNELKSMIGYIEKERLVDTKPDDPTETLNSINKKEQNPATKPDVIVFGGVPVFNHQTSLKTDDATMPKVFVPIKSVGGVPTSTSKVALDSPPRSSAVPDTRDVPSVDIGKTRVKREIDHDKRRKRKHERRHDKTLYHPRKKTRIQRKKSLSKRHSILTRKRMVV